MPDPVFIIRRRAVVCALSVLALTTSARLVRGQQATRATPGADKRWYEQAVAMRQLALSWGDQSYGAVLVLDDKLAGEGPSRVVQRGDPDAHAEREAIRDAQRRLKRSNLEGSVLYSTSRPCSACEAAAAAAGVSRMYFGEGLQDAGTPKQHGRNQQYSQAVRINAR